MSMNAVEAATPSSRRRALLGHGLGVAACLSGCGALQGAKNAAKAVVFSTVEDLKITAQADVAINIDDRGGSLPVTVRVYQLADSGLISRSTYADLIDRDREILGTSLMQRYEFVVFPQSTSVHEFPIRPGARFIAVMAIMRKQPTPSFYLFDSTDISSGGISVDFGSDNMSLVAGPAPLNKGGESNSGPASGVPAKTAGPSAAATAPKLPSAADVPNAPPIPAVPAVPALRSLIGLGTHGAVSV